MKLVLLSGGSGKRLWPMSNDSRSKQFLKVLRSGDGQPISMLQRVWAQLKDAGLQQDAYVCASKGQLEMICAQLGEVRCIEEPARRDTFPAIALSVLYLLDVECVDEDDVVAVLPIDPYVESTFFKQLASLADVLRDANANLALMGVVPTEPSNKFGYIRVEQAVADVPWCQVTSFVEKPAVETAEKLIGEGALWNCGVFAFRLSHLRDVLNRAGYPTTYQDVLARFAELPKRSFDYEVVEREENIVVVRYHGSWKDLGTWEALCEEMADPFVGYGEAYDCENTHVINELGIPVITMGLQSTIVVSTPDGILVADKSSSAEIKNIVKEYNDRPMYEERRWGNYRVLDYQKLSDGTEVLTKSIILDAHSSISYQRHMKRSEVWTILEGMGHVAVETSIKRVCPGDVVLIQAEQWHALRADSRMMLIEVQRGTELVEEDVERRYLTWEEVLAHCQNAQDEVVR